MQLSTLATLFTFALANLSVAAPVDKTISAENINPEAENPSISKRALGNIYICPAYDWQPDEQIGCTILTYKNPGDCHMFISATYRWKLSSVGPDPGTWCTLYTDQMCTNEPSDPFSYPGMGRLDGYWSKWNDNTGSIRCWW